MSGGYWCLIIFIWICTLGIIGGYAYGFVKHPHSVALIVTFIYVGIFLCVFPIGVTLQLVLDWFSDLRSDSVGRRNRRAERKEHARREKEQKTRDKEVKRAQDKARAEAMKLKKVQNKYGSPVVEGLAAVVIDIRDVVEVEIPEQAHLAGALPAPSVSA